MLEYILLSGRWLLVFGCRSFCLEDNTERSESNLGRSLGIKTKEGGSCLEDSTLPVYAHRIFYMFWYCLPDSSFCYSLYPETSSRVTLATLGIGFQPKLPTTDNP